MSLTVVQISILLCSLMGLAEALTVPELCKIKNFGYRIQDPEDCHSFYVCLGKWGEYKLNCGLDKRFNESLQKCIIGKCPPCVCLKTSGDNMDEKGSFMSSLQDFLLPNNMEQALMDQSKDDLKSSISTLNISSTNLTALKPSLNPKRIEGVAMQKVSRKEDTLVKDFNISNSFLNSSKLLKANVNKTTETLQGRVTNFENLNFAFEYPSILETSTNSTTISPTEQTTIVSITDDIETELNSEYSQIYNGSSYIAIESLTPTETTKPNKETTAETTSELPTESTTVLLEEPIQQQSMIVAQNTVEETTDTTTDQPNEFTTQSPLETATQTSTVKGSFGKAFTETPTTKTNKPTKTLFGRATNIDDINFPIEYSIRILESYTDSTTLSQIELTTAISTISDETAKQFVGGIDTVFARESFEIYDGTSYITTESAVPTETTKSHEELTTEMASELPIAFTTLLSEEPSVQLLANTKNMAEAIFNTSSDLLNESTTQSPLETSTQALTVGEAFTEIPATKINRNLKALLSRATYFEVTNMPVGHHSILDPYIDTTTFPGVELTTTTSSISELQNEMTTHTPKELNTDPISTAHLATSNIPIALATQNTESPIENLTVNITVIEFESTLKSTIEITELPTATTIEINSEWPTESTTIFTEEATAQTVTSDTAQITQSSMVTTTNTKTLSATTSTLEIRTETTNHISDDSTTHTASAYLPTFTIELTSEATTSAVTTDTTPEPTIATTVQTTEATIATTAHAITAATTTAENTPERTEETTHAMTTEPALTTTESIQDTTITESSNVPPTTTTLFTTERAATMTESIQPTTTNEAVTTPLTTTTIYTTESVATTNDPTQPTTTTPTNVPPTTHTLYTTHSTGTTNESIQPTTSHEPATTSLTTTTIYTTESVATTTEPIHPTTTAPTNVPPTTQTFYTTESAAPTTESIHSTTAPITTTLLTTQSAATTIDPMQPTTTAPTTVLLTTTALYTTDSAVTVTATVPSTDSITTTLCTTESMATTTTSTTTIPLTTTTLCTTQSGETTTASSQPTETTTTTTATTTVSLTTTILYTTDSTTTTPCKASTTTSTTTCKTTTTSTTTSCKTSTTTATTTCKPPSLKTTTAYKTEATTTTATTSCRTPTTTTTISTTTTTTACKISTVTTTINSHSSIPCNRQQTTTTTTNNINNNKNKEETSVNSICAKHDDVYFIKHSKHCKKYYSCYQHQAYPQVCPGHFYFDEKLQMCNYPDAVDCKIKNSNKIHLEQPKPDDCKTLKSGTFIRDCKDCNKYYVCLNGRAVALYCPRGQYFDNESYICNFKALVKNCAS